MGGLFFLAFAYFAVGQAAANRNESQGAADAAALAAAHEARDYLAEALLESISDPTSWGDLLDAGPFAAPSACDVAQEFAHKNNADLENCNLLAWPGRGYEVTVIGREGVVNSVVPGGDATRSKNSASAAIEPLCRIDLDDIAEDEASDAPIELRCKDGRVVIDPDQPRIPSVISKIFAVRLVE
ncbi:pilus assembly protein TadG-related protein [Streptomyces sparsus]